MFVVSTFIFWWVWVWHFNLIAFYFEGTQAQMLYFFLNTFAPYLIHHCCQCFSTTLDNYCKDCFMSSLHLELHPDPPRGFRWRVVSCSALWRPSSANREMTVRGTGRHEGDQAQRKRTKFTMFIFTIQTSLMSVHKQPHLPLTQGNQHTVEHLKSPECNGTRRMDREKDGEQARCRVIHVGTLTFKESVCPSALRAACHSQASDWSAMWPLRNVCADRN